MEITDVQVKPISRAQNKLKAFCTVTFDGSFVIKDIRIIEGAKGLIVAMPVKKFTFRCFKCGCHNPLSARFCNDCGRRVKAPNIQRNSETGRPLFQVDVAHPITQELRQKLEDVVIRKYREALETMPAAPQAAAEEDETHHLSGQPAPYSSNAETSGDQAGAQQPPAQKEGNSV